MVHIDPERRTVDVAITCSNFEESLHFYRDVLGFEIVVDTEISGEIATRLGVAPRGFHQVRLQAGDSLIKLMDIESPPPPAPHGFASGVRWITVYVEDIDSTIAELKEKGVEFLADPVRGQHAAAVAAIAPDGILVEFAQV
jgi:glyoxylase I family protein